MTFVKERGRGILKQDISLKEKIIYGTKENPITGLHFDTGEGTSYPEYFFVERHWHHYLEILYITRGSFSFEINLQNHTLNEGDICILNPGDLHQIKGNSSDTKHDVVLFDPCILEFSYGDEFQEKCIAPIVNQIALLPSIYRSGTDSHKHLLPKVEELMKITLEGDERWYIRSKLLIMEIIMDIYDSGLMLPAENSRSYGDINKIQHYKTVVSYMEAHYNSQISLQDIADTIPCNSQYLCRFFKDIAGVSPIQYLVNYRINKACDMLLNTQKTVLEIALDCGFENVSYFIRKFKEIKKCTPRMYRLSNKSV